MSKAIEEHPVASVGQKYLRLNYSIATSKYQVDLSDEMMNVLQLASLQSKGTITLKAKFACTWCEEKTLKFSHPFEMLSLIAFELVRVNTALGAHSHSAFMFEFVMSPSDVRVKLSNVANHNNRQESLNCHPAQSQMHDVWYVKEP